MAHPALEETAHRTWPLPTGPWLWPQSWHDLAFLHWPIPVAALEPLIPRSLTIDQYDDSAWIGVVPFWMSGVTIRGVPPLPGLSTFPELNVRTYVRHGERPGVWFLSLDAASRLIVLGGRLLYSLPYYYADMHSEQHDGRIHYVSLRSADVGFDVSYRPTATVRYAEPGSLEHFLTERYRLYAADREGLYFADIHHARWPLQSAEADITRNDMLSANGLAVDGPPIVHFAKRQDAVIWPLQKLVR